ncbi:GAP family protein [Mycetocola zhadangensis]|uniref:GAP family protein n=1 Tax=Mycetocola zhadangensis TaxID=1164595 RepID=A0A3L7J269_9MICO|nr:GAP family protein [Mycetocola zhadangensis]RLQ84688.1 GAP family protein [Mycetocola zhadangensis]GGE92567.1 hypothetical protein GCM10011313_14440 [Mycetocola zhadangensis]
MTITLAVSLLVLALIDSTSFGTLLIPIWLLLAPGAVRAGRVLLFLGTVAGFYFVVGILLSAGVGRFLSDPEILNGPVVVRVQLVVGLGLFAWSFFLGKKKRTADGTREQGRLLRWRDRAMNDGGGGSVGSLIALALGAAALELASMLPYLAAIGLVAAEGLDPPTRTLVLAAYCLVMITPALLLLIGRLAARRAVEPLLTRIASWMEKRGGETTAWVVGILGFFIARDALVRIPEFTRFLDSL